MRHTIKASLIALTLLLPGIVSAAALPTQTLLSYFDNNGLNGSGTSTDTVGTGTMTYSGDLLGDGIYAYANFYDLTLSFSFDNGSTFTQADLNTDPIAANLNIIIAGATFQFSAVGNGPFQGSADFTNSAGDSLAFSPAGYHAYAYFLGNDPLNPVSSGYYGASVATAIPEPSTIAAIFGASVLGLAVWQRRRAR